MASIRRGAGDTRGRAAGTLFVVPRGEEVPGSVTRFLTPTLSRLKYTGARRLSPKRYWDLMGRLRPVAAVTSDYRDLTESLASGTRLVALMEGLDVVSADAVTLHIGSGLGRVEYHLRHRVRRCVGVDISASMVKRARENVPFDDVEFVETDGDGLAGWPDGSFDLIYSFFVFQHLPRAAFRRYVADAARKLRHGGHFVFQLMVDETGARRDPPDAHPYGLRYYRRRDVERLLEVAGFGDVRRVTIEGGRDDGSVTTGDVVYCATRAD